MKLEARKLIGGYGRVQVLHEISITVPDGGVVAILGPNGAGKSTLLKTLAGHLPVMGGELLLGGEKINGRNARWLARKGVVLVPQVGAVFPDLSVEENLRLGALHNPDGASEIAAMMDRFPVFDERRMQSAGSLSGGERQLLAVASALLMRPKVLLLDEPTTGLSPLAASAVAELIADVIQGGTAVAWVVEQMPELALKHAGHAYFIEAGQISYDGPASTLLEAGRLEELMLQHA